MVRTRFAPSPTGYLHIGGVRTALFNWLYARQHGGQFLLRIDDTDAERNVTEALAPILHGFRWLGLDWDEGPEVGGPHAPYFQSQRLARYQAAAQVLLDKGLAYRDYARPEELQAEREAAERDKRPFLYSRSWMAESDAAARRFEAEGRSGVVRLKMPREGRLVIADRVRGDVEFEWAREQDHVIQRADGTCLYHLASVVDDHDFEISHVIRAEEHLSNTPRQVFIFQGLGYDLPAFAHLPYVAEPGSKNKLSKRKLDKYLKNRDFAQLMEHGQGIATALGLATTAETFNPVIVDFYERTGYLPDAILNYLVLLGWSFDDKTEFFTRQQMIDGFSLERVTKAPASFDPKKLWAFQDRYMQQLAPEAKLAATAPYLSQAKLAADPLTPDELALLARVITAAGDRLKTHGDILTYAAPFFTPDDRLDFDPAAMAKQLGTDDQRSRLRAAADRLRATRPFEPPALEAALKAWLADAGLKMNDVVHALRVAVTGRSVGAGLFDCLALLGPDRVQNRLTRALAAAASSPAL